MFPTISKSTVPPTLAYPLSPKLISESLAHIPQAQDIGIHFWYSRPFVRPNKHYRRTKLPQPDPMVHPVFSVGYSYRKATQYQPEEMAQIPLWDITVQPVPSILKHRVKELLQNEAFPKAIAWLFNKQDLNGRQEHHSLKVFYDENKDELKFEDFHHP